MIFFDIGIFENVDFVSVITRKQFYSQEDFTCEIYCSYEHVKLYIERESENYI